MGGCCRGRIIAMRRKSKTIIFTTEAQPPDHITTPAGHTIVVKDTFGTHKWLGGMFAALGLGNVDADILYHLQAAARAFHSREQKKRNTDFWITMLP